MNEDDESMTLSDILNPYTGAPLGGSGMAPGERYLKSTVDSARAHALAQTKERERMNALRRKINAPAAGPITTTVPNPVARPPLGTVLNRTKLDRSGIPLEDAPAAQSVESLLIANALAIHREIPDPRTPGVGVCAHDAMVYPCITARALTEELPS